MSVSKRAILVTGGAGYLGTEVVQRLQRSPIGHAITVFDIHAVRQEHQRSGVEYIIGDVRDEQLANVLMERRIETVVHLASIVNPGGPTRRAFEYSIDVGGTENVLRACLTANVRHLVVTSSGAAYGYYSDNPVPLRETDPIRGNQEFAYADHKRRAEELLATHRRSHPQLKQLVFRPGTILGARTENPITRLFLGKRILGVKGFETPFVFIWDQDVANCIALGVEEGKEGIFNLAGDGVLTLREIAGLLGKPYVPLPPALFRTTLWMLQRLRLTSHGPEQLLFLQYRPVLDNEKLKTEFGYVPQLNTRETFLLFARATTAGIAPGDA